MKTKTILNALTLGLIAFATIGCSKEELLEPIKEEQIVTYEVTCEDCLLEITSSKWNASNELERSKNQYFNVTGSFKYSFTNTNELRKANATVSVSAMSTTTQDVTLIIYDNQNRRIHVQEELGFSWGPDADPDYSFSAELDLHLKDVK